MWTAAGICPAQVTGNGTVSEPSFPTTFCYQIAAETTTTNGMTGEPASETDDTQIQTALTNAATSACATGNKVVELTLNSNGNNAFVIKPIAIPAGVTLLVDAGVTVFGSKVGSDYYSGTSGQACGVNTSGSASACYPLITVSGSSPNGSSSSTGAALMGYGIINGRGYDAPTNSTGTPLLSTCGTGGTSPCSWWQLADNARSGGSQNNPTLVYLHDSKSSVLYKITVVNSPMFHVKLSSNGSTTNNFIAWGVKVLTPYTARNTDGIDPGGALGVSIVNSVISDGDDEIAISGSSNSQNYSFTNLLLTSGHGISIGSSTAGTVSNILANGINFSGQWINGAGDNNSEGLRIKSYCGSGAAVTNVTYENVCMQNVRTAIDLNPYYDPVSGSNCPSFGTTAAPITYQNMQVLTESFVNLEGLYNSTTSTTNLSTFTLNNVYFNTLQSSDLETPEYDTITLTGTYYPSLLAGITGTSVTDNSSNATLASSSPISCPASNFPALVGELTASTTVGGTTVNNRNKAFTVAIPATVKLQAVIEPTVSETSFTSSYTGTYTGAHVPDGNVEFFDGSKAVGTGSLSANGTLASVTITNPTAGAHTYTATYANDDHYSNLSFGSLTVTVTAGPAAQLGFTASPAGTVTLGGGPGTVTVAVQDAAGDTLTSSSAPVTLTVTGPNSYSQVYGPTNANSGVVTFNSLANPPAAGTYYYTATSGTLTSAVASEAVYAMKTLTVTGQPASRLFGDPNPAFTYTITGYANGDNSSVVSGGPTITTAALRDSSAGSYSITVGVGNLSASGYTFVTANGTLTVNGSSPQTINFNALPSVANSGSYQLSASTSSGLPVSYTVTGTGASVSGTTLTLTSAASGQTVTVTATQSGNGNYAAATSVAQSFTAQ